MNFNLGMGPMSKEIVDILLDYTKEKQEPLMVIASRNQVDADSGYVMHTAQLARQLHNRNKQNLLLCRDHCGPYFLDSEKSLTLSQAMDATKKTIATDIENGFDLIHIDTSRIDEKPYDAAAELIEFALGLNPNIMFEFGTEENVGVAAALEKYRKDVEFAKNFPNVKFVVAQTGSLCFEDKQAGFFYTDTVGELVDIATSAGIRLKEHNADYLTADQICLRKATGVHAMNIAPQLGVAQTKLIRRLAKNRGLNQQWESFVSLVIASDKWKKWTTSSDDRQKVAVSGHYFFNSYEYDNLMFLLYQKIDFGHYLKKEIYQILDLYVKNLK